MSGYVHINWTRHDCKSITRDRCLDCKTQTRFMGFHQDYYGWDETCLRCGRHFQDGEWIPLEFARGVRAANIRSAKDHWRHTPNAKIITRKVSA